MTAEIMNRVRSTFLTALLLAGGASAVTAQANKPAATPPAAVPVDKGARAAENWILPNSPVR